MPYTLSRLSRDLEPSPGLECFYLWKKLTYTLPLQSLYDEMMASLRRFPPVYVLGGCIHAAGTHSETTYTAFTPISMSPFSVPCKTPYARASAPFGTQASSIYRPVPSTDRRVIVILTRLTL